MAVAAKPRPQKRWLMCLLVLAVWSCASAQNGQPKTKVVGSVICEEAPPWTAPGVSRDGVVEEEQRNPMLEGRGKVLVVALTAAWSHHSLEQAEKLGALESYFHGTNMSDVSFILVNSAQSRNYLPDLLSKNLTAIVLQENAHEPLWNKLGGRKDYVFIYDRCGRLTYKIPFPLSIIHHGQQVVESSVISTFQDDICGEQNCYEGQKSILDKERRDDAEDSKQDESRENDIQEDSSISKTSLPDARLERVLQSRKEEKPSDNGVPATSKPPLLNGLYSFYRNIMKHMPWASKDKKDDNRVNSIPKFLDEEEAEENAVGSELTEETQRDMCNITQKSICRAWSKKKLDHARICCNLHTCNRSTDYLRKHCKHYPEHRCKKVELVLQCCNRSAENDSQTDEGANTRASVSSHPKS